MCPGPLGALETRAEQDRNGAGLVGLTVQDTAEQGTEEALQPARGQAEAGTRPRGGD